MQEYTITYYNSFKAICTPWQQRYGQSSASAFCSPEWHKVVLELYKATFLTKRISKITYFSIGPEECNEPELIGFFSRRYTRGKKIIEFSPLLGPSDYYDFVCAPDTGPETLQELLKNIASDHKAAQINFAHIKADTPLARAILAFPQVQLTKLDCVAIHLPECYDAYFSSLSKSVRQNIRTAYNRLRKDGHEIEFGLLTKDDLTRIDFNVLKEMYGNRNAHRKEKYGWKTKVFKLLNYPLSREKDMFELASLKNTHFSLGILKIKGENAAYFFGFERNGSIEINRVVINPEFRFYSPGLLLLNEYIKVGIPAGLKTVDLTVGDEKYKFDLGGNAHQIISGNIRLS